MAAAIVLMSTPAAWEIGGVVDVLDPVAYVASALIIATACLLAVIRSRPARRPHRSDRDPQKRLKRVPGTSAAQRTYDATADDQVAEIVP